jgi:hypothetical protein
MQEWHSDALFNKAKSYIELAFEADRGSYPFPLLAAVALELLGKSALAKIHPALIADPRGEGRSILYAFGVPQKPDGSRPQTIVAKTVFSRLEELVPNFTEDDRKHCIEMSERRNREVHTGEFAYEERELAARIFPDFSFFAIFWEESRLSCSATPSPRRPFKPRPRLQTM